jgi:hypothetical protein
MYIYIYIYIYNNKIGFICSIVRYEFEKNGNGFNRHIEYEHNLWNYFYYLFYLDITDSR